VPAIPQKEKTVMMKRIVLALGMASLALYGQSQNGSDSSSAPGMQLSPAESVNSVLGVVERQMMGLVKAMPADRYGFSPAASIFVPSQRTEFAGVRTFAALAIHVAQTNYELGATINGIKPEVDVAGLTSLKSKDQIVDALAASFVFVHDAVNTLTPDNALQSVRVGIPDPMTRLTLGCFIAAHASAEYGQMVVYLRMNGIVPPASKKNQ
jgi:hypothetical protein